MALNALARALAARNIEPRHEPTITDNPDALFFVEGKRIAVECTNLTPDRILKFFSDRRDRAGVMYEIVIPREPHLWVKKAIESKHRKIQGYIASVDAAEAWLLVHCSSIHQFFNPKEQGEYRSTLNLLRY